MRKMSLFLVLVLFTLVFSNCYYHNEETLYSNDGNACDTTNVTFRAKIAPIFQTNCLRCHGNAVALTNGAGIRLEDYADVNAHLDRAYGAMAHLDGYLPMPKDLSTKIDECSIKKVRIWKDAGGLDN
jgi:hypothetical protein